MSEHSWIKICSLSQLIPDTGVCALVNGHQVAVFRTCETNELFAVGNYCPKGEANVLSRGLIGDTKGDLYIASPLYKHKYKLTTGECLEDPQVSIPVYPVREVDGLVEVAA